MVSPAPHLLRWPLPPRRAGRPASPDLLASRASLVQLSGDHRPRMIEIAGVACALAEAGQARAVMLHLHGGGYRNGSAAGWAAFGARLAEATGARVLIPEYALAPEEPCPAALHQLAEVAGTLASDTPHLPLILSGDSAGGGLALALATILQPPLAFSALVLLSPWLDLRLSAASYQRCADTDSFFSLAAATEAREAYLQGMSAEAPIASPLLGPLEGLPPVLVQASTAEVLLDDSLALVQRLAVAGVRTELHLEPDAPHVWPVVAPDLPASGAALVRIARFLEPFLGEAS